YGGSDVSGPPATWGVCGRSTLMLGSPRAVGQGAAQPPGGRVLPTGLRRGCKAGW
ncbi:unnamed protein product, partial [Bubo scandiacus]